MVNEPAAPLDLAGHFLRGRGQQVYLQGAEPLNDLTADANVLLRAAQSLAGGRQMGLGRAEALLRRAGPSCASSAET